MNIGFFYGWKTYPPGTGGSIHGYQLARNLVARGHRLFSWYHGEGDTPYCRHFRGRELLGFLRRADVLYVRTGWHVETRVFKYLRRAGLRRRPIVWEFNGLPEEILYLGGTEADVKARTDCLRRFARDVDAAIAVTDEIARYLREAVGVQRTYCIPNGSDPHLFEPGNGQASSDENDPLTVAWVGRTSSPWHDCDVLIEASRILAQRGVNVRFVIYGDRERLPDELPENVECAGLVPYLELGRHLNRADVGLQVFKRSVGGSVKDGSPLKLFDYMSCGLAIVAQGSGQTGEVIDKWRAGVFTSGSAEDIAEKICQLEQDRPFCRQLGRNARRAVVAYHNWQRVAEQTETVLNEVRNAAGRRG